MLASAFSHRLEESARKREGSESFDTDRSAVKATLEPTLDRGKGDILLRVLVIDDERKTSSYLKTGLSEQGFVVDVARNGEDGLHLAAHGEYDLVILDVMLPQRDGWSVLANLRGEGNRTPVLMLTARDDVPDRVKGFELGADDYLIKPFAFSELVARMHNLLRRGPVRPATTLCATDLEFEFGRQRAKAPPKPLG